jgi:hypothetical protein
VSMAIHKIDWVEPTLCDRESHKLNQNTTEDIMTQTTVANFIQAVKEDPSSSAQLIAALNIESYYKIAKEKIKMNHAKFTDRITLAEKN